MIFLGEKLFQKSFSPNPFSKTFGRKDIHNENEPLRIKKRGEDGNKVITVRIREDTLEKLDKIAAESNYSRNELINLILSHGVKNIIIEEDK